MASTVLSSIQSVSGLADFARQISHEARLNKGHGFDVSYDRLRLRRLAGQAFANVRGTRDARAIAVAIKICRIARAA